jgi:hypothetical protein
MKHEHFFNRRPLYVGVLWTCRCGYAYIRESGGGYWGPARMINGFPTPWWEAKFKT